MSFHVTGWKGRDLSGEQTGTSRLLQDNKSSGLSFLLLLAVNKGVLAAPLPHLSSRARLSSYYYPSGLFSSSTGSAWAWFGGK